MNIKITPSQVDRLFDELCVDLGFCLSPKDRLRLQHTPESDPSAMTELLLRVRGIDADTVGAEHIARAVRELVTDYYRAVEDAQFKLPPPRPTPVPLPPRAPRRMR